MNLYLQNLSPNKFDITFSNKPSDFLQKSKINNCKNIKKFRK